MVGVVDQLRSIGWCPLSPLRLILSSSASSEALRIPSSSPSMGAAPPCTATPEPNETGRNGLRLRPVWCRCSFVDFPGCKIVLTYPVLSLRLEALGSMISHLSFSAVLARHVKSKVSTACNQTCQFRMARWFRAVRAQLTILVGPEKSRSGHELFVLCTVKIDKNIFKNDIMNTLI